MLYGKTGKNCEGYQWGIPLQLFKANAYGLGVKQVASALYNEGARIFFIATAEEGAELRSIVGKIPDIYIFSGHMTGDTELIKIIA